MVRIVAVLAVVLALARPAAAQDAEGAPGMRRVTLDHVEATPSVLHKLVRLRLFVSAIDLENSGSVLPIGGDPMAWTIDGGAALKKLPYLAGVYGGADVETAIVFVVETAYDDETLQSMKDAIKVEVLEHLATLPHTQAGIIGYGSDVALAKPTKLDTATGQLEGLVSDGEEVEGPKLVEALDRAVQYLRKVKPTVEGTPPAAIRRMIVVVSDGRTEDDDDRDSVTDIAERADRSNIRIHTIAYSKADVRRPMLNLGELSKVSHGTLRWIREKVNEQSMTLPFARLREEILRQYVLTLFVPATEVPTKVSVSTEWKGRVLASTDVKVPNQQCGEDECKAGQWCTGTRCVSRAHEEGRGVLGWLLIIVGIAVGLLVALVGVGFVITKSRERAPKAPKAPPQEAPAPAAPTSGPHLYVMSGPETGQKKYLRHGFTIGKAPGSDLSLAHDGYASSNHAHVVMDTAGNCSLVDQGSTNGTYINGVRITESRLFDGMSIRCGSTELRFLAQ